MPLPMRSMRWRIASGSIVLLIGTLALLAVVLLQLLRTTYLRTLEAGVAGQARLVATIVEHGDLLTAAHDRVALVAALHDELGARITLIAPDGTVLADAPQPPGAPANLSARPEVRDALANGQGASERASVASGEDTFYVAVPIGPRGAPAGVARMGVPLTTIAQAQTRLGIAVLSAALLAILIALMLAVLIARRTTRPLLELRAMAARLAGGDLAVQVPIPLDEEVAALAQDFNLMASQLRQLLAVVEAERQRLATVLATMADGILMLSSDNTITLANPAAERMLAITPAQLPLALTSLSLSAALLPAIDHVRSHQGDHDMLVIDTVVAPATQRSLRAIITHMPAQEPNQALVVLQDLTDLRRVEQARRSALANISHDLRTPLASLQAMIETLEDGALDDRDAAHDFLHRMDAEVQGLNRLVSEFLELTRIESGQLELYATPTELRALLEAVAARMAAQAQQRGSTINLELPAHLPVVTIDTARIEQVLLNLLQNALTFTPRGGRITIGAAVQADRVAIWVRDTGAGIAPADVPHVFERFYKADRARSSGGAGLGLAIARHLVERHGGQIAVESAEGAGTTITFTLPLGAPATAQ